MVHEWYPVGVNGPFLAQTYSASLKLLMHSKDFLKFCTVKGAIRHIKSILFFFLQKKFVEGEWFIVNPKMLCPQNIGSALKDLYNFAQSLLYLFPTL